MSEWWTYGLSDFLLFSPRTYYRLIERHNTDVWPAQLVTMGLGLGLLWMLRRPTPARDRAIAGTLAVLWVWVAWAFVWRRYAGINWAASYFGWLFVLEAGLLAWFGVLRRSLGFRAGSEVGLIGMGLFALAVVIYPGIAPLVGRGWRQAEVFGVMPDPTVIGTLGVLLQAGRHPRWGLLVVPTLLCAISGATLWAMGSPETWLALGSLVLAGVALRRGSSSRGGPGIAGARAGAERETSP